MLTPELMTLVDRFEKLYFPLRDLQFAVADFVRGDNDYPFWSHMAAERDEVAMHIEALEYLDDDTDAGGTTSMPAVLGVPYGMLDDVRKINAMREQLSQFLRDTDKETTPEGVPLSKYLLDKAGLRRFNRNVVRRMFRVFDEKPDSISFLWVQSTTIRKLSRDEAISVAARKINKQHDRSVIKALEDEQSKLLNLPEDAELARLYLPTPQPKANLVIKGRRVLPQTVAHLPIFYPASEGDALPQIIPLPEKWQPKARIRRSDAIIEELPLCPLLNIYRYMPEDDRRKA